MNFKLIGRFKPYVRMTQRGKWGDPQAQEYLSSKAQLGYQLRQQMNGREPYPRQLPLSVFIKIVSSRGFNNCDLDNQIKSCLDSAQQIVYADDRWVDHIHAWRVRGEANTITFDVLPLAERSQWCCPCCGKAIE